MKLEGDYLFEAPVQEVWNALFDPRVLAAVMPGCEKLEKVDGAFVGELSIKVGPVQGKFAGKVDLKDVDAPKSYTMVIDGKGATGFMKATASVKLEEEGEHTRIRYSADAQVGGKIASVGQRLVEVTARAVTKQSLEGLHENVKIRAAAFAEAAAARKAKQELKAAVAEEVKEPVAEEPKAAAAEETKEPVSEETKEPAAEEAKLPVSEEAKEPVVDEPEAAKQAKEAAAEAPKAAPAPSAEEEEDQEPPPAPVLKTVSQADLAASVAKEVAKELVPAPVRIALILVVLAGVAWLVWRLAG
jgi:carbon monoxide dehydrogenase subunit G